MPLVFLREYTRFEDRPLPAGEPGENYRTSEPPPDHAEFAQDPLV